MLVILGHLVFVDVLGELIHSVLKDIKLLVVRVMPIKNLLFNCLDFLVDTLQFHKLLLFNGQL